MRPNRVKMLLNAGKPAVGTWLSLGNVPAARFLARSGFDWLTVDIEHSMVDMETSSQIFGAVPMIFQRLSPATTTAAMKANMAKGWNPAAFARYRQPWARACIKRPSCRAPEDQ